MKTNTNWKKKKKENATTFSYFSYIETIVIILRYQYNFSLLLVSYFHNILEESLLFYSYELNIKVEQKTWMIWAGPQLWSFVNYPVREYDCN